MSNEVKRICMVCSGNICRSPMAEELLRQELLRAYHAGYEVCSAGTFAMASCAASKHGISAMRELGFDIRRHRAQQLDRGLCLDCDLILCMSPGHVQEAARICPDAVGYTHTLLGYAVGEFGMPRQRLAIEDPYGMSLDVYRECRDEISDAIVLALPRILKGEGMR